MYRITHAEDGCEYGDFEADHDDAEYVEEAPEADEQDTGDETDPRSIRHAREKLDDNTISDELREGIEDSLDEWESAEADHERKRIEDTLDHITCDPLDDNLRAARDHLRIVEYYYDDAPESSMERIRWRRSLNEECERVQRLEEKTENFKKWERERLDDIKSKLAEGGIDVDEAEQRYEQVRDRRRRQQRSAIFSAAGMDDLDDTMWEQRVLPQRATDPDLVEKASDLRDQLKSIPWHKREQALEELAEQADIDDDTMNEIKERVL